MLVAFEVLHYMKKKNRGQDEEVALKLDIFKAYDRVDWQYLKQRMHAMGFPKRRIKWIMLCVKSVNYKISFNGNLLGSITHN